MPPFVSEAQRAWMHANKPEMAKRWAHETPNLKSLPEKKTSMSSMAKKRRKHG